MSVAKVSAENEPWLESAMSAAFGFLLFLVFCVDYCSKPLMTCQVCCNRYCQPSSVASFSSAPFPQKDDERQLTGWLAVAGNFFSWALLCLDKPLKDKALRVKKLFGQDCHFALGRRFHF